MGKFSFAKIFGFVDELLTKKENKYWPSSECNKYLSIDKKLHRIILRTTYKL